MKRRRTGWAILGILSLAVAVHGQVAMAERTYIGTKWCIGCHRHKHEGIVKKYVDSPMAKTMAEAKDDNVKGDFAKAPIKRADVAYVLAAGEHQQAYLDKDMKVLPAKWIVKDKKWVDTPAVDATKNCVGCHMTAYDHKAETYKALGIGCEMCHGPGSAHKAASAVADRKKNIVIPNEIDKKASAMICGQCHSAGKSKDGAVPWAAGYRPGDNLNAFFNHAEVKGPGANQQYTDLVKTKHYGKGVVCETCHDPHGETGHPAQLKASINDTCLKCHKAKVGDIPTHAAKQKVTAPAGATCATCHMPEGRHLFDKSVVKK
jgi:predicted CXXCH cytochrome family protein